MPGKTAVVIGATGLIGGHLVELLQLDESYETIRALVRKPVAFHESKVEMKLVNFADHESVKMAIDGSDAVFCAIGTTRKQVKGDTAAYRKVDYDIPVNTARFCAETACPNFLLVSSAGADSKSKNFYLRLKGEVEDVIRKTAIKSISFFRPSMLTGKRKEFRLGEKIVQPIMNFFAFLLVGKWEKYRPIDAKSVAAAMIEASKEQEPGVSIYEYTDIRLFAHSSFLIAHPHQKVL